MRALRCALALARIGSDALGAEKPTIGLVQGAFAESSSFMAERAHSRDTVVVKGASHVVMVSRPDVLARPIEKAAAD